MGWQKGRAQTLEHIRRRTAHRKGQKSPLHVIEILKRFSFKKGQIGVRKGVKVGEETRLKQSMAKLGKLGHKHSEESKLKLSLAHRGKPKYSIRGEKSPFWKGGITPFNLKLRKSIEYREWRRSVFQRDNYSCVHCGDSRGGNLEADHIKPFAQFPDLRFDVDNGRTLCNPCHRKTDTYGYKYPHVTSL